MRNLLCLLILIFSHKLMLAQNSLVGDGFGGRSWYKPMNYTTGSYSAYTTCGPEKQLYGWGVNSLGQLGVSNINESIKPLKIPGMDKIEYYSTGYRMGAIRNGGEGWIWGGELWGLNFNPPSKVINDAYFLDASLTVVSFVKKDGTIWTVGSGGGYYFGLGDTMVNTKTPIKMNNISKVKRTAVGFIHHLMLTQDGHVYRTDSANTTIPKKYDELKDIVDIKACTWSYIALDKEGNVWSWGKADEIGRDGNRNIPTKIPGLSNIVAISGCADGFHFGAINEDKELFLWGQNFYGQCATTISSHVKYPIKSAQDVIDVMVGEFYTYIVKSDLSLHCCGYGGPIWLDQPQQISSSFIQLNPSAEEIGLCLPADYNQISNIELYPEHTIVFPNAFSPNGDGLNDIFKAIPTEKANLNYYYLKIYNRWGQLVFQTLDINKGWNGNYGGKSCDIGNYFFIARYDQQKAKTQKEIKGEITLIR
jgi:gliding motility-associated-like protein